MTSDAVRITIKLRLGDKHTRDLNRQAKAVNTVWNYCNEVQQKAVRSLRPWTNQYQLERLTSGASEYFPISADTIGRVCRRYDQSRRAKRRPWLKWRGQKSLGWIPFKAKTVRFDGQSFKYLGKRYTPMHLRDELSAGMYFRDGSFNQDARGRWYINVPVDIECLPDNGGKAIGVDLGLKDLATTSDGETIEAPRFYRRSEAALATSQRARKSKRVRVIHAKIVNRRKDYMHKTSAKLAKKYGLILVGDVSPSKLARTKMAKSIHDAGWASFKHMLSYKAIRHGGRMIEVNEAYSSQVCSECGALPPTRPKGIADLGIRDWECSDCGAVHDRDVNAARNILRVGLHALAEGAVQ